MLKLKFDILWQLEITKAALSLPYEGHQLPGLI